MKIGIPRERKTLEKRVALTPAGAKELTSRGHQVLIETGAGEGAHFTNEQYIESGSQIVESLAEVWNGADLLVKVKEPHDSEFQYFREDLILFDFLHLASMPDVTRALLNGGITSIAYELVSDEAGRLPLLEPMSDVAGKLSVINGAFFLLSQNGGRGVLLSGTEGVPPRSVVVVGGGIAGRGAIEMAIGLGANVTVLDINAAKLSELKSTFGEKINAIESEAEVLAEHARNADLLIGAVLVPGAAAPKVVTEDIIRSMKSGSVFVDISIDQGGCGETSRTTSLEEPVYEKHGVIHYAVANMPSQTARTSTLALTAATLPYVIEIAEAGGLPALESNQPLRRALHTYRGKLTNEEVSEAVGMEFTPIDEALAR